MPDPWLSEEELKKHQEEVENHPLTKQAEEAKAAHEEDAEELRKQQEENRKAVEEGDKVAVYAGGAVVGYRDADNVPEEEDLGGIRPKAEGRGGATEGELGPTTDSGPAVGEASTATPEDPTGANREVQAESRASEGGKASGNSDEEAKTSKRGSGSKADKEGKN